MKYIETQWAKNKTPVLLRKKQIITIQKSITLVPHNATMLSLICTHVLHVSVTWEICKCIFAAVGFGNGSSELLENVVELRWALHRPVFCHTKAFFQSMELPLVSYQLVYENKNQKHLNPMHQKVSTWRTNWYVVHFSLKAAKVYLEAVQLVFLDECYFF